MTEEQMKAYVKKVKLLPLFYHDDIAICKEIVKALYTAGIRCIEFTNRGPLALENFKLLLADRNENYPDLVLAIGTIQNQKEAQFYSKWLAPQEQDSSILLVATQNKSKKKCFSTNMIQLLVNMLNLKSKNFLAKIYFNEY